MRQEVIHNMPNEDYIILSEKLANLLTEGQIGSVSGIALMNRIALLLAPTIKSRVNGYSKPQLNEFLKTTFPPLANLPLSSRHMLVDILTDTINKS